MQGRIDLGKSDEATAQSGSVDELAGELIGCRCARSATSLQLPYSLSRLVPLQPCSLTCWLSIYRITIVASPPPIDMDACPLARASPGLHTASSLFHVSCFSKVDSRHLDHVSPGHQPSFPQISSTRTSSSPMTGCFAWPLGCTSGGEWLHFSSKPGNDQPWLASGHTLPVAPS